VAVLVVLSTMSKTAPAGVPTGDGNNVRTPSEKSRPNCSQLCRESDNRWRHDERLKNRGTKEKASVEAEEEAIRETEHDAIYGWGGI
jgi:hypothetical protein